MGCDLRVTSLLSLHFFSATVVFRGHVDPDRDIQRWLFALEVLSY
jgi:hypothetical protein